MGEPPSRSYDPAYFDPLALIEEKHFWFRARARVIATIAHHFAGGFAPGYRVLEIGCGTGNILRALQEACAHGMVMGMDLFGEGLVHARRRSNCPLVQGDVLAPPFGVPFHMIGAFDVLEHLEDDRGVLVQLRKMLAPEGKLLLTVPAHPALWSYFDEHSCQQRRYQTQELAGKLSEAGFEVEYLTEYMMGIMPLMWIGRKLAALGHSGARSSNGAKPADLDLKVIPVLNGMLGWVLSRELGYISRRKRLPFGASILAVARPIESPC